MVCVAKTRAAVQPMKIFKQKPKIKFAAVSGGSNPPDPPYSNEIDRKKIFKEPVSSNLLEYVKKHCSNLLQNFSREK